MLFTIQLTLLAASGGLVLGTVLALSRMSGNFLLSTLAAGYVNLLRAVPLVLVIFWFYFLMPLVGAWILVEERPIAVGALASSLVTFTLFEAAYYCEIMRAGIRSVPAGQTAAGHAIGMTRWQTTRYIVLPQAFRNMLPVLLTQTIILFQDVSLVYLLSITDFVGAASKVAQRDNRPVEMYLFVGLTYLVICLVMSRLVKRLQMRLRAPA
jgi:glutamate/aspartate transport system permease protein